MTSGRHVRRAGILAPLFSIPSRRSWGIGEIGDLVPMATWLSLSGQRVLQLLPITETTPADASPYGALTSMAIDPQFITLDDVEDFAATGGEGKLDGSWREMLDRARTARSVDYSLVRKLKRMGLRRSFEHFLSTEWQGGSERARALRAFAREEAWWLEEYALFRALHARFDERSWKEWPEPLRTRRPEALAVERQRLANEILYRQYLQWIAGEQWTNARRSLGAFQIFGDVAFMVGVDSADVWVHQQEFDLNRSIGTPPDDFNPDGQDWGLPAYRWDVMERDGFRWLRERASRAAELFDGCRVDHVVGFYRMFTRASPAAEGSFTPVGEASQTALGEKVMGVFLSAGIEIVAEDLGTVPQFVHDSLDRLGVPGYKVLHWQRRWQTPGQPLIDPTEYPRRSVATTGTHDTAPLTVLWESLPEDDRRALLSLPSIRQKLTDQVRDAALRRRSLGDEVRCALLEALFGSASDLVILPLQDAFGWTDRINEPGLVSATNWTWRLPWSCDRIVTEPEAALVGARLREWASRHGR